MQVRGAAGASGVHVRRNAIPEAKKGHETARDLENALGPAKKQDHATHKRVQVAKTFKAANNVFNK